MTARASLALAACILAVPSGAGAYVRSTVPGSDTCLWWGSRTATWSLNERATAEVPLPEAIAAVRRAFGTWEAEACSDFAFVELGTTAAADVGWERRGTNLDLLVFRDVLCQDVVDAGDPCRAGGSCANAHGCWDFASTVIAVTTTTFDEATGEIVDADVEFNAAGWRFTSGDGPPCEAEGQPGCVATDLENTATHEIGHFLGLDHSPVIEATMYASAPLGETDKRTLSQDDVDGLCAIYPAGGATSICAPSFPQRPTTYGIGCGCSGAPGPALLGLLVIARALARRR